MLEICLELKFVLVDFFTSTKTQLPKATANYARRNFNLSGSIEGSISARVTSSTHIIYMTFLNSATPVRSYAA